MRKFTSPRAVWRRARRYWQFTIAVATVVLALIVQLVSAAVLAHWLLGVVSLLLTIPLFMRLWDDWQVGKYGTHLLPATAIFAAVLVHEQWVAILVVIVVAGTEVLNDLATRRAGKELRNLRQRAPKQARLLRGRKVLDIALTAVQPGDKLLVEAGERVPIDAVVLEGKASIDESLLGEEASERIVAKKAELPSGALCVDGAVTVRALRAASDSQYEQLVHALHRTAIEQTPFVRLADRYSLPFMLLAYAVAIVAWVFGHHAGRFLDVLVVATSYPLLLAPSLAFMAGLSQTFRHGIVVKTGTALEQLADAETFVFTKTGTLTRGQLRVDTVTALKSHTKTTLLQWAASLEQNSSHPLAVAIVTAADRVKVHYLKAKHVSESHGLGLHATLQHRQIYIGNEQYMEQQGVAVPARLKPAKLRQTAVFVAADNVLAGVITFEDKLRPEAKQVLQSLAKLGVEHTVLLTGNGEAVAKSTARELGITRYESGLKRGDKLRSLENLPNRPVLFVGNEDQDIPLFASADVGLAFGKQASIFTREAADVVVMHDDLSYIAQARNLAKRTLGIAQQSIVSGMLLSTLLMLAFASGRFAPLLGIGLQAVVNVLAITNTLRAHRSPKTSQTSAAA